VLGEDALHGDDHGPVLVDDGAKTRRDRREAALDRRAGVGAHHTHVDERGRPVRGDVHHAHAAARQPGVDAEHSQRAARGSDGHSPTVGAA
jgi:hypothetical protein